LQFLALSAFRRPVWFGGLGGGGGFGAGGAIGGDNGFNGTNGFTGIQGFPGGPGFDGFTGLPGEITLAQVDIVPEPVMISVFGAASGILLLRRVQLRGTDALRGLALVVTWWTVLIEGALAVVFVAPTRTRLSRWRDVALLHFAWTTDMAAPVKTFGWTLSILGLAQCDRNARLTRFCYVLTFPRLTGSQNGGRREVFSPIPAGSLGRSFLGPC
jgi:hypothetical protein